MAAEPSTWFYVEADAETAVARHRCMSCGDSRDVLDSAEHWNFPRMWACPSCSQSIAEIAAGLHADERRRSELARSRRSLRRLRHHRRLDRLHPRRHASRRGTCATCKAQLLRHKSPTPPSGRIQVRSRPARDCHRMTTTMQLPGELIDVEATSARAIEIVIPVHNEEHDLEPSVRRLHTYLTDDISLVVPHHHRRQRQHRWHVGNRVRTRSRAAERAARPT